MGFVHDAQANPAGRLPVGINQIGRHVVNHYLIGISVIHKNPADGATRVSDCDCRRICESGWPSRLEKRPSSPRSSGKFVLNGPDVFWVVGAGKQGSKIEKLVGWLAGSVKVGICFCV